MLRSILAILCFSAAIFGQEEPTGSASVNLPDAVMKQVIGRIVRFKFKAGKTPRTIPIFEASLKADWLPDLPNIRFKLVPGNQTLDYPKGVMLIQDLVADGDVYSINVGWGDPFCDASGETWKFTVRNDRVRLWPTSEGWGGGCGGTEPAPVRGLKLGDVSPNEFRGYEFFAKGKLKPIRLGVSTREDIQRIFGDPCESQCDYDENWEMWIEYFEDDPNNRGSVTEGDEEYELVPRPAVIGTIRSVDLSPKHRVSFLKVKFPGLFAKGSGIAIADSFGTEGFEGAAHSSYDIYKDGYGLSYHIYQEETFNNLKKKLPADADRVRRGDLTQIEYDIPSSLEDKVYEKRPISK